MRADAQKITDFGLARLVQTDAPRLTQTGLFIGTTYYVAPEQATGERNLDQRCDLFSLGVVFYKMGTGQKPFFGNSAAEIVAAIQRDEPRHPSEFNPKLRKWLGDLIMRLLSKAPDQRPQSASDVLSEFVESFQADKISAQSADGKAAPSETMKIPMVEEQGEERSNDKAEAAMDLGIQFLSDRDYPQANRAFQRAVRLAVGDVTLVRNVEEEDFAFLVHANMANGRIVIEGSGPNIAVLTDDLEQFLDVSKVIQPYRNQALFSVDDTGITRRKRTYSWSN